MRSLVVGLLVLRGGEASVEDPTSVVVNNSDRTSVRHDRLPRKRGRNYETKPIEKVATPQ